MRENVPRSFTAALVDPVWGEPARTEKHTVTAATGAIVQVNQDMAKEQIRKGAQVVRMLAVYEEKIKDGKLVRKVRLVADGRQHIKHGETYSSTPSREELLILLHLFACKKWEYYHVDEIRAFLNAPKRDIENKVYCRFSGDSKFYEIVKAVYGLKTASREYQDTVADRMVNILGFQRLHMSSCIYVKVVGNDMLIVYAYVDDFIIGGSCNELTLEFISGFREIATTTEPIKNAERLLGMIVKRDYEKSLVLITMNERIDDLVKKYPKAILRTRNVPMPTSGYLVREHEIEEHLSDEDKRFLNEEEISEYMSIVGSLIWIQGIRLDIIFAVLYLAWFTRCPRVHHMNMALYCIGYLNTTKDLPLVLGGDPVIRVYGYSDASLGTGPKSRSITGQLVKLSEKAGAVFAKASAQQTVRLSSFEAELDGLTSVMKSIMRINNILDELGIEREIFSTIKNDNKAMIEFVKGKGVAKGVRHIELRMWFTREKYQRGNIHLEHMPGKILPADKLTKLGNIEEHRSFVRTIMGHELLD